MHPSLGESTKKGPEGRFFLIKAGPEVHVSTMLNHLALAECCLFVRLSTLYKIVYNLSAPQVPNHHNHLTCQYHPIHYMILPSRKNYYMSKKNL